MNKSRLLSILLVFSIMLVAVLGLSACVEITPEPVVHVVTFDSDGGSSVEDGCAGDGLPIAKPADPTKEGYEFLGWFLGETKYNFDMPVTEDITLVAHWEAKQLVVVVTHTVTFDSDGGSSVQPITVEDGKLATKPQNPTKEGYVFANWSDSSNRLYDFTTPVTEDITLTAEWDPEQYTVTFDTDGGSDVNNVLVTYGSTVARPAQNPEKTDCYFEGWYIDEVKYDFSTPVTNALTITAKWSNVTDVNNAFIAALSADYSNYTSEAVYADSEASYINTYMKAGNYAYYFTVNDWDEKGAHDDHFIVYDSNGSALAMYRLNENAQWVLSAVSHTEFTLALNWDSVSIEDVYYDEGIYRVYDESITAIVYALFLRSNVVYDDLAFTVKDGHIYTIVGHIGDTEQLQWFTDFGETEIEMPAIPAVTVSIETNNREVQASKAINLDELIGLTFAVKTEGQKYSVTNDMIDLGGLNLANPVAGEYTLTLSFETWDGVNHAATTKVTVQEYQEGETFADIFGKDYSSATIMSGTTTFKYANNVYTSSSVANAYYFAESDGSLTKYVVNGDTCTQTPNNTFVLPRLEILFALSADLFEQVDDTDVYVAKNNEAIIEVLSKTLLMPTTTGVNKLRDYSISLTIELGRITKISYSYYYVANKTAATTSNGTIRNLDYVLSNFGTTEIEIPQSIQDMRNSAAAAQVAIVEDKKYSA